MQASEHRAHPQERGQPCMAPSLLNAQSSVLLHIYQLLNCHSNQRDMQTGSKKDYQDLPGLPESAQTTRIYQNRPELPGSIRTSRVSNDYENNQDLPRLPGCMTTGIWQAYHNLVMGNHPCWGPGFWDVCSLFLPPGGVEEPVICYSWRCRHYSPSVRVMAFPW